MLRHIDPILGPDLLHILRSMGHGDEIAIVDANFPAATMGKRVVRLDGVTATHAAEAILHLLPLDQFEPEAAFVMQQVHAPDELAPICVTFQEQVRAASDGRFGVRSIERFAFYERAKTAFAVVATGESRLYGNLILKKGVIEP
ncbi:L-fucose mutarotase [Pseudoxanthobacter soli DSM 19599]|uniref:L-fucose mutarotase n=1 Tax=Pseudoxanthobacter soli DSM 19599 TaxID=1123029 RepID=A0A1M7ZN02_9HYPH|nr:RbsD/FucU domain-containing protein [Pseudoxanthobacter soli]SHO66280.1 L-fucose mutarotase [Pseudoxanthobacter soli DSM 19599]